MQIWNHINQFDVSKHFPSDQVFTHAQLPTPIVIAENTIRVFFATRDIRNFSSVYFIDLEYDPRSKKFTWSQFSMEPALTQGPLGSFDEHGVYPSFVFKNDNVYYMFYIGWNRGLTGPLFYSSIGLAESLDGKTFSKISEGPMLARNKFEPYLVTSPFLDVLNGKYKMYFVSGEKWVYVNQKIESRYDIKSIESHDFAEWESKDRTTIIPLREQETNIARPWIVEHENERLMYFSFLRKNESVYKIGVAKEMGPNKWLRLDDDLRFIGFDGQQAMAYPSVVQLNGEKYMFVNGNNYGREGFHVFHLENLN